MARIVVVEDEAIVARDLERRLTVLGHDVAGLAADAAEAVALVARELPDLVLLDVSLRGGVDGVAVAEAIRGQASPALVFVTAYGDRRTFQRAKDAGAYGFLRKPFDDGDLERAVEIALDRRRLERELAEGEKRFRLIAENVGDLVMRETADRRIVYASPSSKAILGRNAAELVGLRVADLLAPEDVAASDAAYRALERGEQDAVTVTLRYVAGDGSRVHLETTRRAVAGPARGPGEIVSDARDVSDRVAKEEALRESERFLSSLLGSLPGMVFRSKDAARGEMEFVSEGCRGLTGLPPEALVGPGAVPFLSLVDADDQAALRAAWAESPGGERIYRIRGATGETRWVLERAQEVRGESAALVAVEGFLADITERKRAEESARGQGRILEMIATGRPLAEVLTETAALLERLLPGATATVRLLDREGARLRTAAGSSLSLPVAAREASLEVGREARACGLAAHLGEPVASTDVLGDPCGAGCREAAKASGFAACWASPVRGRDGVTLGVASICWPVSRAPKAEEEAAIGHATHLARIAIERERTDTELRASSRFNREIVTGVSEGIVVRDRDLRCVVWNPAIAELTGIREADALGRRPGEVLSAPVESILAGIHQRVLAGETVRNMELDLGAASGRARGARVLSTHAPYRDAAGEIVGVITAIRDISALKAAEEEKVRLHEAIERKALLWRETFDAVDTPIVRTDAAGLVLQANRVASGLLGGDFAGIVGRPLAALSDAEPWPTVLRLQREVLEFEAGQSEAIASGTDRVWHAWARRIPPGIHEGEQVIAVARDITALVRLRESVRRAERASAMGDLLAGVAHEVRNPLFGISANLDSFEAEFGDRPEYGELAAALRKSIARLEKLMSDLLDYGHPRQPELEEAPLEEVLREALASCEPVARRRSVALRLAFSNGLPLVRYERRRLGQVFQNLLENAIQHSEPDAFVTLAASSARRDGAEGVECRVEDSGPGFDSADLPRVFEPFFTRRRGGTGLGLSLVQRIVEEHGGSVVAQNREGRGAAVSVFLPAAEGR